MLLMPKHFLMGTWVHVSVAFVTISQIQRFVCLYDERPVLG